MKSAPDLRMGDINPTPSKDDSHLPDRSDKAEQQAPMIPDNTLPIPTSKTAFGSTASLPIIIPDDAKEVRYPPLPQVIDRHSPPTTLEAKRRRKSAPMATAAGSPISREGTKRPPVTSNRRALSESNSVAHTLGTRARKSAATRTPPSQSRTISPRLPGSWNVDPDDDEDSTANASDDASSIISTAADDNEPFTTSSASLLPGVSAPAPPASSAAPPSRIDKPSELDQKVNHLLTHPKKRRASSGKEAPPETGYVYILRDPAQPGWLKIGFTTDVPVVRRDRHRYLCEKELGLVYDAERPHRHCHRAERLVQRQLAHFNRPHKCPGRKCGRAHQEWFEIDEDTALRTAKRWMRFVKQDPWGREGDKLTCYWKERLDSMGIADKEERHDDHAARNKRWDRFVDITRRDRARSAWKQVKDKVPPFLTREWSNPWRFGAVVMTFVSWWTPYECLIFWTTVTVALLSMCSK